MSKTPTKRIVLDVPSNIKEIATKNAKLHNITITRYITNLIKADDITNNDMTAFATQNQTLNKVLCQIDTVANNPSLQSTIEQNLDLKILLSEGRTNLVSLIMERGTNDEWYLL